MYLTQGLHRAIQQTPAATMTICGDRHRTFREVGERVARLAGALRGLGVAEGDRVAMLSLNSDRYHEYLLAVPWADAVLNPVNIRWSAPEIVYSFADSATRVLLIDDAFAPMLPALRSGYPDLETVIHCGDGPTPEGALSYEELIAGAEPIEDARRGGDRLAGLFYTGGTTGFPKGVMLSHRNLVTSALGLSAGGDMIRPGARYLHAAPMFHLADLAAWASVTQLGGTHAMIPMFDPVQVMAAVERHGITEMVLIPVMIQAVVDHPELGRHDLSSLRMIAYGGSVITQAVLERAMAALPNTAFSQAYGMTELAPVATMLSSEDHAKANLLRSAGRAAPHCEVLIADPTDVEVPRHTVGEIVVRGDNVMQGYWNKPAETAEALRNGWMHTGDGAYMDDDGYVFIVDRLKDMIVVSGMKVFPNEVEDVLTSHPKVLEAAVIGLPDAHSGECVVAYIVRRDASLTVEDIREFCRQRLTGYKTPRRIEFRDALPKTNVGKILRRALRDEAMAVSTKS